MGVFGREQLVVMGCSMSGLCQGNTSIPVWLDLSCYPPPLLTASHTDNVQIRDKKHLEPSILLCQSSASHVLGGMQR